MNDEDHVLLSEKLEDQLKAVEWAREQNGWNPGTHWNHPKKGCFFIPHTEKGRTVCAVFFVLHQLISRQRWANNIFVAGTATARERKATP